MEFVTVGMLKDMIKDAPDDVPVCVVNRRETVWEDMHPVAKVSQVAVLHCDQESPSEVIALYGGSIDDDIRAYTSQLKEMLFDGNN